MHGRDEKYIVLGLKKSEEKSWRVYTGNSVAENRNQW
jgi:hypothetical protein